MKANRDWKILCIFVLLSCSVVAAFAEPITPLPVREFTSADGKKVIAAIPVGYDIAKQIIHLRVSEKEVKKVSITKLSVEDRLYIIDHQRQLAQMLVRSRMLFSLSARFSKKTRTSLMNTHKMAVGSEQAIAKCMAWLKATQHEDGSWCEYKKIPMTALALNVFLNQGATPNSKQYGDTVKNAITYLVRVAVKNKGRLADDLKDRHWPYQHAMATHALAEAQTICGIYQIEIPDLTIATKAAGDWILNHQHKSGAWGYGYDMQGTRGGDVSITSWHLMALYSCKLTGLWKEKEFKACVTNALAYIKDKQNSSGGIGYSAANPSGDNGYTLTGAGMLAFQMWGKAHDSVVRKGSRYIKKNVKFQYQTVDADLYALHYYSMALKNRGGSDWGVFLRLLGTQLIDHQNENGSWKNVGGGAKVKAVAPQYQGDSPLAIHYRSCLCAMTLQAPHRYLTKLPLKTLK